jgi:hypothetical protein
LRSLGTLVPQEIGNGHPEGAGEDPERCERRRAGPGLAERHRAAVTTAKNGLAGPSRKLSA